MSMPVPDLSSIIPSKAKTWVNLVGGLLTFVVPFVLESANALPAPWPAAIGVVLFILTALGVYHAPYAPAGTTLAIDTATPVAAPTSQGPVAVSNPEAVVESVPTTSPEPQSDSGFTNPYK